MGRMGGGGAARGEIPVRSCRLVRSAGPEFKNQQPGALKPQIPTPLAPGERIKKTTNNTESIGIHPSRPAPLCSGRALAPGGVGSPARSSQKGRKVCAARGTLFPLRPRCPLPPGRGVRFPSVFLSNSKINKYTPCPGEF